jgi:hypothetical protein
MQWEYDILDLGKITVHDILLKLNGHGSDGWELVHIDHDSMAFLKRPIQKTEKEQSAYPCGIFVVDIGPLRNFCQNCGFEREFH